MFFQNCRQDCEQIWLVIVSTPKCSIRNIKWYFLSRYSFLIRRNSVLHGSSSTLFINIYDRTKAKHGCKLLNAALQSPDAKDAYSYIINQSVPVCKVRRRLLHTLTVRSKQLSSSNAGKGTERYWPASWHRNRWNYVRISVEGNWTIVMFGNEMVNEWTRQTWQGKF